MKFLLAPIVFVPAMLFYQSEHEIPRHDGKLLQVFQPLLPVVIL
jgi:hypothetical protein